MISPFDQWLTRASTHRLLRLLVEDRGVLVQGRTCLRQRRSQHSHRATWSLPLSPEYDVTLPDDLHESTLQRQARHPVNTANQASSLRTVLPFGISDSTSEGVVAKVHALRHADPEIDRGRTDEAKALELWLAVLKEKARERDIDGIGHDWTYTRERGLSLPVHGRTAEEIWHTYCSAAVQLLLDRHESWLLVDILEYAQGVMQQTGERYVHLAWDVMSGILLDYSRSETQTIRLARRYYKHMLKARLTRPADLTMLLESILSSEAPDAGFQRFRLVYTLQQSQELDEQCVRLVRQYGHLEGSDDWLAFFRPSPLPDKTTARLPSDGRHAPTKSDTPVSFNHAYSPALPLSLPTRQTMSTLMGEAYGIDEKSFSDDFCAKVLATKFFSLDACIKGLQVLGVEHFGSIAVLELVRRAREPAAVLRYLEKVRECGIRLQNSVFCRMVKHFAANGHGVLLDQLISSDQHPDEYTNFILQRKLLPVYVDRGEWLSMEIALVALSLSGQNMESTYWNVLLRHNANEAGFLACQRIFEDMRSRHIRLKTDTVRTIFSTLLPTRSPGKAPNQRTLAYGSTAQGATDFAMAACTYAAACGEIIPPSMFAELLKRYGLTHQIDGLERLLFWLGDFYSAERIAQTPDLPAYKLLASGQSPMRAILQDQMIGAIVIWEWRTGVVRQRSTTSHDPKSLPVQSSSHARTLRERPRPETSWTRGISLLKHLRDRGHPVTVAPIRRAIAEQLWKTFGPGRSSRSINDILQERNQMTLQEYLEQAEKAWPGIFTTDRFAGLDFEVTPRPFLLALFGKQRRPGHGEDTIEIDNWAETFVSDSTTKITVSQDRHHRAHQRGRST